MYTIQLNGYTAAAQDPLLRLGTRDSYGIEQLQILPGKEWQGLQITATFVTPEGATRMEVPEDGVLEVPAEATACALTAAAPGRIVFAGVAEGVQRITADLGYLVSEHAPVEGSAPAPTPTAWEQYVTRMQAVVNEAVPPDGSPGQVLTRTGNGNVWADPPGGDGWTRVSREALPGTPPGSDGAAGEDKYFSVTIPAGKTGLELAVPCAGGVRLCLIRAEDGRFLGGADDTGISVYSRSDRSLVLKIQATEITELYYRFTTSPI